MSFYTHICHNHSHKKRKDSLEIRAVCTEISMVSWNLPNGPKHRGSFLKNMTRSDGDLLLTGAFHATMDKIEADVLQIAKKWNWKWISYIKNNFSEDSSYKCQFCTRALAPLRPVSQVRAKYNKDEVTDVSGSNQNINTSCKNILKLTKLKDLFQKKKMNVHNSNSRPSVEISMEEISFQIEFFLLILHAFTVGTEEYYPKCYRVNDAKGLQIAVPLYASRLQIINIGQFNRGFSKSGKHSTMCYRIWLKGS